MTLLTNLQIDEISFVDAGANPEANVTIFKRKEDTDMDEKRVPKKKTADEVTKTADEVAKTETFDALTAELKTLTDKLNEHVEKAEDAEFHKIAERYEILGTDADKLAPMLKAASKSNPTLYETAIRILDSALTAVEKSGTFDELGKTGTSHEVADIQKIAAQIQKTQPNLTWRQALDTAFLQHPELQ